MRLDSLPVPVCSFARAHRCRLFPGLSGHGKDASIPGTMFGLSAHLRVAWPGVITAFDLAPTNASDLALAPLFLEGVPGLHPATAVTEVPSCDKHSSPTACLSSLSSRRPSTRRPPDPDGWYRSADASRVWSRSWSSVTEARVRGLEIFGTSLRDGCGRSRATRWPFRYVNSTVSAL